MYQEASVEDVCLKLMWWSGWSKPISQTPWENRLLNIAHRQTTFPMEIAHVQYSVVGNRTPPAKHNAVHALRVQK